MTRDHPRRRRILAGAAAAAGLGPLLAPAIAAPAAASGRHQWIMVTSWPKNLPGPGTTAQRLADRIARMSEGRLTVKLHAAGEVVPALEVFDAVATGVAQMGHTAAFFWRGKMPASAFFTTIPFGLTADEHAAWIHYGGGQELWDELYGAYGVRAFMAGNTGMSMGGWFKRELKTLEDFKGLKCRVPGLAGEVLRRLGALPVVLPPAEIFPALQSGSIDGAEFLGPWSDLAAGFYKVAPFYYAPGYHEPNGTGESVINRASYDALSDDLQEIVATACHAESARALAEAQWRNAEALETLVERHGVKLRQFPADFLRAARELTEEALADLAAGDSLAGRIRESYDAALRRAVSWAEVSSVSYLRARAGG